MRSVRGPIQTVGGRNTFSCRWRGDGISIFPAGRRPRFIGRRQLEEYLRTFRETRSLNTAVYRERFRNASYFLGLVRLWQAHVTPEGMTATSSEALHDARLGHGVFRRNLVALRGCCYVSGITSPDYLKASHIKPWAECNDRERLDPHNGLLLTPAYDHLFDRALISFEDDGHILISPLVPSSVLVAFRVDPAFRGQDLGKQTKAYLEFHRERHRILNTMSRLNDRG